MKRNQKGQFQKRKAHKKHTVSGHKRSHRSPVKRTTPPAPKKSHSRSHTVARHKKKKHSGAKAGKRNYNNSGWRPGITDVKTWAFGGGTALTAFVVDWLAGVVCRATKVKFLQTGWGRTLGTGVVGGIIGAGAHFGLRRKLPMTAGAIMVGGAAASASRVISATVQAVKKKTLPAAQPRPQLGPPREEGVAGDAEGVNGPMDEDLGTDIPLSNGDIIRV